MTTVVRVNDPFGWDVYIGRANRFRHLKASVWANPFVVGRDGTRDEVIQKYRAHLLANPVLLERLPELRGKRLACWCAPQACHGDVLVEMLETPREHARGVSWIDTLPDNVTAASSPRTRH